MRSKTEVLSLILRSYTMVHQQQLCIEEQTMIIPYQVFTMESGTNLIIPL